MRKTLNKFRKRAGRADELRGRREQSRGQFENIIGNILGRGQQLADQPTLTAQDLFGEEIQNLQDNARANANATKSALSRSLLAGGGGGDVTGQTATNLLRTDQATNQQLGGITDRFNTLATRISEARQSRGDSLLGQALQGGQNLLTLDQRLFTDFRDRETQKEQARKQRRTALLGGLLNAAGAAIGCWVAEELYSEDPKKVSKVRQYLYEAAQEDKDIAAFLSEYQLHGDQWAEKARRDPEFRKSAKRLFDEFYELSKAA